MAKLSAIHPAMAVQFIFLVKENILKTHVKVGIAKKRMVVMANNINPVPV